MTLVLLTGAGGFLGRRVCKILSDERIGFVATDLSRAALDSLAEELGTEATLEDTAELDLRDKGQTQAVARRFPNVSHIIHLASPVPRLGSQGMDLLVNGLGATLGVLDLLDVLNVRHVGFASSVTVYGSACDSPLTEAAPMSEQVTSYGLMKQSGERLLGWAARAKEFNLAAFRPSQIYGPGEPHGLGLSRMIQSAVAGEPIVLDNAGEDARDIVFVDDVARAMVGAARADVSGAFNISSGCGYTIRHMAECIAMAVGEAADIQISPRSREATGIVYANDLARKQFGWAPVTTLEDGIKQMVLAERERSAAGS